MNKKAKMSSGMWLIVAIIAIAFVMSPTGQEYLGSIGDGGTTIDNGGEEGNGPLEYREIGNSATLYLDAFTGSWGGASSKTEVSPSYTILDSNGAVAVSDTTADNLSTYVGEEVDVYITGASYYMDPVTGIEVNNAAPRVAFEVYEVATVANMDIVVYDETGSNALTPDDHEDNTADYAGGALGASETYPYYAKLETAVADKTFRLGAICTYYCGDEVDDFTLEESGWNEVSVPSGTMTTSFSVYDDANESTSCSYKRCYVPDEKYIELNEWDDVKYKFLIDTDDSTGPSANGDSYVGATYLDYGCEVDATGDVICDWYKHNADRDPGAVGLDENPVTTNYDGLNTGFCIEPK